MGMWRALSHHWPEYLIEAAGLGIFMISASVFTAIFAYPGSPIAHALPNPIGRRLIVGMIMGLTAIGIIYSPWGRRSGAHINPAVTLSFLWLHKIAPWDAFFYVFAQFVGGLAGVWITAAVLGKWIADPAVSYVVTIPGVPGMNVAFLAELLMSFILMLVVLASSNTPRMARFTGIFAGTLVALFIVVEAPLSGMSINPARTFASALPSHVWTGAWIYFIAPPLGMIAASEFYLQSCGIKEVICAKLHHDSVHRCIFRCGYRGSLDTSEKVTVGRP